MKTKIPLNCLLWLAAGAFLTATPASAEMIHRYSFNEPPGSTTVVDSILGSNGVARLSTIQNGGGGVVPTFSGTEVTLDGVSGYIDLPNKMVSVLTNVTFEFWVTWITDSGAWARILDFGAVADLAEDTDGTRNSGTGTNYLFIGARSNGTTPRFAITPASNGAENQINTTNVLSLAEEHHIVVTWGPSRTPSMYIDGAFAGAGNYDTAHALSVINDQNAWLGRSQWGDAFLNGSFNEFRIHNTMLGQLAVLASKTGGPNQTNYTAEDPTSISLVVVSNMTIGTRQTATINAVFPTYGSVVIGAAEVNLTSSAPSIVVVEAGNVMRAAGQGTATITASLGGQTSTATITTTPPNVFTALRHRYSFNEANGSTTITDSVGGALFAGTVNPPVDPAPAILISNGLAVFPAGGANGTAPYISLPANMLSTGFTNLTVELWMTWNGPADGNTWARVFDFGDSLKGSDPHVGADGLSYVTFTPRNGGGVPQTEFRASLNNAAPFAAVTMVGTAFPVGVETHVVCTFAPEIGYQALYFNGKLMEIDVTPTVGTPATNFQFSQMVDPNMWVGVSQWNDTPLSGQINEMRLHEGILDEVQIALSRAAGPNGTPITNPGSLTNISFLVSPLYIGNPVASQAILRGDYQNVTGVDITSFNGVQIQSSDTNVFLVTATGAMTPVSLGTASLIASYKTFSTTSSVSVLAPISLVASNLPASLPAGGPNYTVPILAGFPGGITGVNVSAFAGVTRASSDTNVATISQVGVATLLSPGTTTITSTYRDQTNQAVLTLLAPVELYTTNLPATVEAGRANYTIPLLANFAGGPSNVVVTGFALVTRSSSDPTVATIANNGVATIRLTGTTTITSTYGGLSHQAVLTVVQPAGFVRGTLIHRYSFSEAVDSSFPADSVGTADGTVRSLQISQTSGNFNGTGQFVMGAGPYAHLPTTNAYIDLPNGLFTNLSSVTVEGWFTWFGGVDNQRVFDFGMSSGLPEFPGATASTNFLEDDVLNPGRAYFFLSPQQGRPRFAMKQETGDENPSITSPATITITTSNLSHFAIVYDQPRGVARLYVNGQRAGTAVASLPLSVVDDRNNWIGRSQWQDPFFNGSIDEFRIYNGPMLDDDVAAAFAAGPTALPVYKPRLSINSSGANVVISWFTNATGFVLEGSGTVGTGYSTAGIPAPTVVGDQKQVTIPLGPTNNFFRLRQ